MVAFLGTFSFLIYGHPFVCISNSLFCRIFRVFGVIFLCYKGTRLTASSIISHVIIDSIFLLVGTKVQSYETNVIKLTTTTINQGNIP